MTFLYCEQCDWELADDEGRSTGLCEECRPQEVNDE